jgi:hypothetical protein
MTPRQVDDGSPEVILETIGSAYVAESCDNPDEGLLSEVVGKTSIPSQEVSS